MIMTPQEFIAKWKKAQLSERSAAQQHFLDLCELLGQPKRAAADPEGAWYTFERGVHKTGGGEGITTSESSSSKENEDAADGCVPYAFVPVVVCLPSMFIGQNQK